MSLFSYEAIILLPATPVNRFFNFYGGSVISTYPSPPLCVRVGRGMPRRCFYHGHAWEYQVSISSSFS